MTRSEALRLREIIESVVETLDDETASEAVVLFPKLHENSENIVKGKRYVHDGKLKRAKKDMKKFDKKKFDDPDEWEEMPHKKDKEPHKPGNK